MASAAAPPCPECQRLQEQLEARRVQLEALQATVAQLQEQLACARKDSSTSSLPPSSDIVKPPRDPAPDGCPRRPGGQTGKPKAQRPPFPHKAPTVGVHAHTLHVRPDCGSRLRPPGTAPRVVQQVDIQEVPLLTEEHRGLPAFCPNCQRAHYAPLPASVEKGG